MERNARFELTVHSFLPTMETGSGHETHLCIPLRPVMSMVLRDIPKLINEATSGLDPIVRNEILDLFQEFIQDEEHSILFSSHITGDLEKIADYITFLHDGKVMLSEPKDDLIYSYGLVRCGRNEFQTVKPEEIIGFRKGAYGIEALTPDKRAFSRNHPGTVVDMPSIDDIMYLYVKEERL